MAIEDERILFDKTFRKNSDPVARLTAVTNVLDEHLNTLKNKIKPLNETERQIIKNIIQSDILLSPSDLAKLSGFTYPAIHKYGKKLEKEGYIAISDDPSNPRRTIYSLTYLGLIVYLSFFEPINDLSRVQSSMSLLIKYEKLHPSFAVLYAISLALFAEYHNSSDDPDVEITYEAFSRSLHLIFWGEISKFIENFSYNENKDAIYDHLINITLSTIEKWSLYLKHFLEVQSLLLTTNNEKRSTYSNEFEIHIKMYQTAIIIAFSAMEQTHEFWKLASKKMEKRIQVKLIDTMFFYSYKINKEEMQEIIEHIYSKNTPWLPDNMLTDIVKV